MDFDEQKPSYPSGIESVVRSLRADVVLGYDMRAEQEIEAAFRVITENLDILSDQDRRMAVRGSRGYAKNDVRDSTLKAEIEKFLASQSDGAL